MILEEHMESKGNLKMKKIIIMTFVFAMMSCASNHNKKKEVKSKKNIEKIYERGPVGKFN